MKKVNIIVTRTMSKKTSVLYDIVTDIRYLDTVLLNLFGTSKQGCKLIRMIVSNCGHYRSSYETYNTNKGVTQTKSLSIKLLKTA